MRLYFLLTCPHILHVRAGIGFPPIQMVEGMISNDMTMCCYFSKDLRILSDIITNAKECCFCIKPR